MNTKLNWKVPSRAQSAASSSTARERIPFASPPTPGEIAGPLKELDFSSENDDWYVTRRFEQSSTSSCSYSVPSRPGSGERTGLPGPPRQGTNAKKYWELGGLGPTYVATPELHVLKERWLAKKAFGKAATAANRLARLRAMGKLQQEEAEIELKEPEIVEVEKPSIEDVEEVALVLDERAKKRDIALALKL